MLRRTARLRKEYLYKKSLEDREATTFDKKKKIKDALKKNKAIPTELRGEDAKIRKNLDLQDDRTSKLRKAMDDEYAYLGIKDPRLLLTTSRDPSSRLQQFLKELRLLFPGAQRVNRGGYVVKDLLGLARTNEMTDVVIVHEHRGEPDGLIVCHLPFGPTAYFGLTGVVLRHDLADKQATMSEGNPHLLFHNMDAKIGLRTKTILQALFPPPKVLGDRVMTFANRNDVIHFRHHTYDRPKGDPSEGKNLADKVELKEIGPRFSMRLFRIELGAIDMKDVETEWVLRPYFNRQKEALGLAEDEKQAAAEAADADAKAEQAAAGRKRHREDDDDGMESGKGKKGKGKGKGKSKGKGKGK